jgi:hypothetical protein
MRIFIAKKIMEYASEPSESSKREYAKSTMTDLRGLSAHYTGTVNLAEKLGGAVA